MCNVLIMQDALWWACRERESQHEKQKRRVHEDVQDGRVKKHEGLAVRAILVSVVAQHSFQTVV